MVTITLVPQGSPVISEDGNRITFTVKDTANAYSDGSNPVFVIDVIPKARTLTALNNALLLAKDDLVDRANIEAQKIASRAVTVAAMVSVTIPNPIFSGDPATYTHSKKV